VIAAIVRDWSNIVLVLYVLLMLWAEYRQNGSWR
jgi:hypothetical protein